MCLIKVAICCARPNGHTVRHKELNMTMYLVVKYCILDSLINVLHFYVLDYELFI